MDSASDELNRRMAKFKVLECVYTLMWLNSGTPKIINFPFGTNGKLMVLGVPIHKQHITVHMLRSV